MTKKTKLIIGVGAVALGAYFLFNKKKGFVNLTAPTGLGGVGMVGCANGCKTIVKDLYTDPDGNVWKLCRGGQSCCYGKDGVAGGGTCPKNIELSK